jgi:hypothetical protein
LSSPLDGDDDLLVDTVAAADAAVFDEYSNSAGPTGIVITFRSSCPEGLASIQLNESAGSNYVLDDDQAMVGVVNDPTETLPGDGYFHGDGVDNYIDFAATNCLIATRKLTLKARIHPSIVDDGDGNTIQRVFVKNGSNYQMSVWRNNTWENYNAPDNTASIAFWVRLVENHGGNDWKPVLTDYDAYPIVADHWYEVHVIWDSDKVGGIPCDILVDDQGTDGNGTGENWAGLANCTDADQSQLTDDRKLYEGDEILSAEGTIHIGATANHTVLFNGLIDWITADLAVGGGAETASCCFSDEGCSVLTDAECVDLGGTWFPEYPSCDPNPCLVRVCCMPDGTCHLLNELECLEIEGTWEPVEETCDPNPCVPADIDEVEQEADTRPTELLGASPNPFYRSTAIRFHLAGESQVTVRIFDPAGRLVRTLVSGVWKAGGHQVSWDGMTENGERAGAGVYLCTFRVGGIEESVKVLLQR